MRRTPALIGLGLLVVIVALFLILDGGDDEDTTTTAASTSTTRTPSTTDEPAIATIVIKDGQPVGGVQELSFDEGDDIRFKVESDAADEVHLHGYDIGEEVEAGSSVEFDVPATITGVFEVELEERVVPIAEITVNPS